MTTTENGFVTLSSEEVVNLRVKHLLEDGLSYVNYAALGSDHGLCDVKADLATGIGFLEEALAILKSEA